MRTKTHIHGSDVILVGFPDLLHDLQLGPAAALNGAFDRDGPLWVVQRQVLKTARPQGRAERETFIVVVVFVILYCNSGGNGNTATTTV